MSEETERRDSLMMLNLAYDKAIANGATQFQMHPNNFESIQNSEAHIREFEQQHHGQVTHEYCGYAIVFQIRE